MPGRDTCELLCLDLPLAEELRASRPSSEDLLAAAERAKALGDPTRLAVALALAEAQELCVCDLAWVCERPEKLVSHHLRQLRFAGLVRFRRDGRRVMYSLTDPASGLVAAVAPTADESA
ncbi:MAG: ArsR/SmtB family transcription factor [Solirubrobacteraceae bacterium]